MNMSDNKNFNDEYQYVEESANETNPEEQVTEVAEEEPQGINSLIQQPSVRRNAIIAIIGLFTMLAVIKCTSSPSLKKKEPEVVAPPKIVAPTVAPIASAPPATMNEVSNSDLDAVRENQKNLENNLSSINQQVNQLNNQISSLTANNQVLQQQLAELQNKQMLMINAIDKLIVTQKTKPISKPYHVSQRHIQPPHVHHVHYYIQAIIPGRAWLINTQGNTITVKVGSKVPNYGVVDKIDPLQGRVITSSGKILRFNQDV
jgi:intracellular multiplication protein IcmG